MKNTSTYIYFLTIALLLYWTVIIGKLLLGDIGNFSHQHDFHVYYCAGVSFLENLNPYDSTNAVFTTHKVDLPFVYPPLTLYGFSLLGLLDYQIAYYGYLFIKFMALYLLCYSIFSFFKETLTNKTWFIFLLVFSLGFSNTLERDISVGNITIFETFIVWIAVIAFLKERLFLFLLLILTISLLKLYLILLLGLLLVATNSKKGISYSILGIFLYAFYLGLNDYYFSFEMQMMGKNIYTMGMRAASSGMNNSLFGLFVDINNLKIAFFNPYIPFVIFIAIMGGITSYILFIQQRYTLSQEEKIFLVLIVFFCIVPRLQTYSYVILLPLVVLLSLRLPISVSIYYLSFMLIPLKILVGWHSSLLAKMIMWYQPYFSVILTFVFYIYYILNKKESL